MESQRQVIENLFPHFCIVGAHRVEQSFFIPNHVVINQMVLHPCALNLIRFYRFCELGIEEFASKCQSLICSLLGLIISFYVLLHLLLVDSAHEARNILVLLELRLNFFGLPRKTILQLKEGQRF